jgi:RNA polymerase sigma factor (sigma-70 family)
MPSPDAALLLNHIRRLAAPIPEADSDQELLYRFTHRRDEGAFALLLRRHGPMVLRVCRRVAANDTDAEDAFQATFLTLARNAASIHSRHSVSGWLYGVACNTARRVRDAGARRSRQERSAPVRASADPLAEMSARELLAALDEELGRLPEKYRAPLVLCYLEGMARDETAQRLGCPLGTLKGRMERGKERLRTALVRRGLSLSTALAAALVGRESIAAVPPLLARTTLRAAALLTPTATLTTWKLAVALLVTVSLIGAGVVGWVESSRPTGAAVGLEDSTHPMKDDSPEKTDLFGDPLPPGALARMGTIRLRQTYPRVVFSADGKSLLSAGADHSVRTWDVTTGKYLRSKALEGTSNLDLSVIALAPDGKALLVHRYSRQWIAVYDVATGKQLRNLSLGDDRPYRAALSPGGRSVAASTNPGNGGAVRLWDVATGAQRLLLEHKRHDESLEFSPDGKFLGVAGRDALRLWDVTTNKLLHSLSEEAECLTFSPDSKTMASGNLEGTVKLWDVATGKEQATLRAIPAHDIQCLTFSPDGKLLAAAGQRSIRLWDVAARKMVRQLPDWMVYMLAFAPDGKILAASGLSKIRLWDVATGKQLLLRKEHSGEVSSIAPSSHGKVLASTSYSDGTLCLWDATTGKLLHQPPGDQIAGRAASLSADGKLVPSGGHDGFVHLWETTTGKEKHCFPIESLQREEGPPFVDAVCLSADAKRLAALARFDRASQINIWDVATGKLLTCRPFEGHGLEVFTPDGQGITVRVAEGVAIQDTVNGKHLVTIPGIVDMLPIAFSPDSKLVALTRRKAVTQGTGKAAGVAQAGSERTAVTVAETATGKEILSIEMGDTRILAFSADGRVLATADENVVRLWEVPGGKEIYSRSRHEALPGAPAQAALTSVAILPGGRALATGQMDGTILVWSLTAETPVAKELGRRELDSLWADLAGDDARKAYRAIQSMELSAKQAVTYLNDHLQPAAELDSKSVKQLIADLDSDEFAVRQKASKELEKYGPEVEPIFREVLAGNPSLEVRKRLQTLLDRSPLPLSSGEPLRQARAVVILERIGSPEARQFLQKLVGGAAEARLTREAKAALERLARR